IGPRATVRLLSVAGSTPYTANWYGTGWWPKLCRQAVGNLEDHEIEIPASFEGSGDEFISAHLESGLIYHPEHLPDERLSVCIDPPEGKGLRWLRVRPPTVTVSGKSN